MPASKSRHRHKHTHQHQAAGGTPAKPKKVSRTIIIAVIFFTLLSLCIGFFIDASSLGILLTSAVLGSIAGFFIGYFLNKSLVRK